MRGESEALVMAPLHFRSLYLKVVLPIVALVLASMGTVWFFAVSAMSEGVRMIAEDRAEFGVVHIRNSMEHIEHEMMAGRGLNLQESIESLGRNPDTQAIRILSPAGRVLYSSRPSEVGSVLPMHVPSGEAARSSQPVVAELDGLVHAAGLVRNGRTCMRCHGAEKSDLGYVDVDISLSRQSAGMKTWGWLAAVAAVVQFLVIGIGIVVILGFVVVRPITRLSRRMSDVEQGNLDVTARAEGTAEINRLVTVFNDMVGRLRRAKAVEEEAQRMNMARVEQLATLGEMAASLAHELRNPLSGVKAAVDVLAGEEQAEEPRRILRQVSAELARVDGVVRQLLNFARPKAPVLARVDLHALLADSVMLSRPRAVAQGASLDLSLRPGPLTVRADAEMVQQVVVNLVVNALQATEDHQDARIVLSSDISGTEAVCAVRDNGPGLPAGQGEVIFRPFMTTKARGTGLGLATSRRLIELQGGRLWLANPGEPGACFTFTLPLDSCGDAG
jgi:two-component system, NtrC family, sensor kinase